MGNVTSYRGAECVRHSVRQSRSDDDNETRPRAPYLGCSPHLSETDIFISMIPGISSMNGAMKEKCAARCC